MSILLVYLATVYVGIIQFVLVCVPSLWLNGAFPPYSFVEPWGTTTLLTGLHMTAVLVLYHTVVVFVRHIPFPFDGMAGYHHSLLPSLTGSSALPFGLFYFQGG